MKFQPWSMGLLAALILAAGCAGTEKRDIETQLVEAFIEEGKTVEIKGDRYGELYVIDPMHRSSGRGCPLARIQKWKNGVKLEDKIVEVCSKQDWKIQ